MTLERKLKMTNTPKNLEVRHGSRVTNGSRKTETGRMAPPPPPPPRKTK